MRLLLKFRWIFLISWLAIAIMLPFFYPNIGNLVKQEGEPSLSSTYSSSIADDMLKRHDRDPDEVVSAALIFS